MSKLVKKPNKEAIKEPTLHSVHLPEVLAFLKLIDKQIINIEKEAAKASSSNRQLFLNGKSSGMNEAHRMIKQRFFIK